MSSVVLHFTHKHAMEHLNCIPQPDLFSVVLSYLACIAPPGGGGVHRAVVSLQTSQRFTLPLFQSHSLMGCHRVTWANARDTSVQDKTR